jgi:hypothetical protein
MELARAEVEERLREPRLPAPDMTELVDSSALLVEATQKPIAEPVGPVPPAEPVEQVLFVHTSFKPGPLQCAPSQQIGQAEKTAERIVVNPNADDDEDSRCDSSHP